MEIHDLLSPVVLYILMPQILSDWMSEIGVTSNDFFQRIPTPPQPPVPKSNKDASVSHNYRPIALSSTSSKVLEWLILYK